MIIRNWLLSLLSAPYWTVVGLILSVIGVLLLFRYGMPYRTRSEGAIYLVTQTSEEDKRAETKFDKLGWLGLGAAFAWHGVPDSWGVAFALALRPPDRLSRGG
jgi:hypothetical protein